MAQAVFILTMFYFCQQSNKYLSTQLEPHQNYFLCLFLDNMYVLSSSNIKKGKYRPAPTSGTLTPPP